MKEFGIELSLIILKTHSAICQGFKNTDANLIMTYAFGLELMKLTVENQSRNVGVIKAAVAVLGDISDAIGSEYRRCQNHAIWISSFHDTCMKSDNEDLKKIANETAKKLPLEWLGIKWLGELECERK